LREAHLDLDLLRHRKGLRLRIVGERIDAHGQRALVAHIHDWVGGNERRIAVRVKHFVVPPHVRRDAGAEFLVVNADGCRDGLEPVSTQWRRCDQTVRERVRAVGGQPDQKDLVKVGGALGLPSRL
jgi:hypothetical protein